MSDRFMQLKVAEYRDIGQWRWVLSDEKGKFLGDREVRLDSSAFEYRGYADLPGFLRDYREAYGGDRELLRRLGAWLGENVFGELRRKLTDCPAHPVVVHVTIPENAQDLLFRPFELAHLEMGASMVSLGVRFVYQTETGDGRRDKRSGFATDAVRVLAVFSLPTSASPLNLRRERYELKRLVESLAADRGVALRLRILQYGATRDTLKKALRESPGWDAILFSGHGRQGAVLLEDEQGEEDLIDGSDLAGLLRPAKGRLSLIVLSACWSAAESLASARRQVGLDPPVRDRREAPGETPSQEQEAQATALPSLGQQLARSLDCAVVGMRYPVGDRFAADLSLGFFESLLDDGQPVPAALQFALEEALHGDWDNASVALSPVTPMLLGSRAADLALAPPRIERPTAPEVRGPVGFPPEPTRFVGRLIPMLRASKALAKRSRPYRGVLFHGMAGGGKTACALELAWRHEEERFAHYVFFKCPDEDQEIAAALADFLHDAENRLDMNPGDLTGHCDDPRMFRDRTLPLLQNLLSKNSILIAIDNMESLLTGEGNWRDDRWEDLAKTLLEHTGESRAIFTSRRAPASLEDHPALLREAVHALSFPESVLLARELPNLSALFDDEPGRTLLLKALTVIQGHPKLLELADGAASDQARLERMVEQCEEDSPGRDVSLKRFFDFGESEQPESEFVETLRLWTSTLVRTLSPPARLLFSFLCRLEEEDRSRDVIEANWKDFLERVKDAFPDAASVLREPDLELEPSLKALAAAGLAEARKVRSGETVTVFYAVHPGVAEAVREEAGQELLQGADMELGNFHLAVLQHGLETETQGGGRLVVQGAERAVAYLMRSRRWNEARYALEQLIDRAQTPAALNRAIPLLRAVAEASRGTEAEAEYTGVLAKALRFAGRYEEAETLLRDLVDQCEARRQYRSASVIATQLLYLLMQTGQLEEALALAERMADFTRRAGMGPWTQLSAEAMRLQILNAMGRCGEVLEAVAKHRERLETLPEKSDADESARAWNVRELILATGCDAASRLEQWETALALNAEIAESEKDRGAGELEMAATWFNDYFPLLRLRRFGEARRLLETCREVFDRERDYVNLGKTYTALADLEDDENRLEAAVQFQMIALKYSYRSGRPEDCAISHNNLSHYLQRAGEPRDAWLAHRLADAVICIQTGSGLLTTTVRSLANSDLPEAPPAFDRVCATVEQIDGVRFRELFSRLPARFPDGDAAVAAVWRMAREERERGARGKGGSGIEDMLGQLPPDLREAVQSGDMEQFIAVVEKMPMEQARILLEALEPMAVQLGLAPKKPISPDMEKVLDAFEPLLQGVADIAAGKGNDGLKAQIEEGLPHLEEMGWKLSDPVRRIWNGERDPAALVSHLDSDSARLVQRILELIEGESGTPWE